MEWILGGIWIAVSWILFRFMDTYYLILSEVVTMEDIDELNRATSIRLYFCTGFLFLCGAVYTMFQGILCIGRALGRW